MPGPAALISVLSGAPQQGVLGSAFGSPLVALVTDVNGNPVSGVTVTFFQQGGQSAYCLFAGGVNTAVTNGSGLATSAAITAGGATGQYPVQAWIGTPGPGAIGPANFWLTNSVAPAPSIIAALQTFWTNTMKANYNAALTALAAAQTALGTLEANNDQAIALGGEALALWTRQNLRQALLGYQPREGADGLLAPQILAVWAANPNVPRDTSGLAVTGPTPYGLT